MSDYPSPSICRIVWSPRFHGGRFSPSDRWIFFHQSFAGLFCRFLWIQAASPDPLLRRALDADANAVAHDCSDHDFDAAVDVNFFAYFSAKNEHETALPEIGGSIMPCEFGFVKWLTTVAQWYTTGGARKILAILSAGECGAWPFGRAFFTLKLASVRLAWSGQSRAHGKADKLVWPATPALRPCPPAGMG